MKLIYPEETEIRLTHRMKFNGKKYRIPYDVDWLTTYVSEESHGAAMGISMGIIAAIAAPFTAGFSIIIIMIAWTLSKKPRATVEIQFTDGLYLRGFTNRPREVRFAEKYTVAPRPVMEQTYVPTTLTAKQSKAIKKSFKPRLVR